MSEIDSYVEMFEEWEGLMKALRTKDEKTKHLSPIRVAFIVLASAFSKLPIEKEAVLYKAMYGLISKENPFKLDDSVIDDVAAILLVASEIKRNA